MAHKYVYLFSEGNANMRELLGGKGANLAEMTNIGLPVPQGFTITTEACTQYYEDGQKINDEIQAQIMELLKEMQVKDGKSIILITHNMGLVAEMADEVCVMYMGRVVEFGSLEDVFDRPSHPYTRALLRSVPVLGQIGRAHV